MTERRNGNTGVTFVGLTQRENTRAFCGTPVVVVNLANELVGRGIPVDVLIFTRRGVTEFPFPFDRRVGVHYLRAHSRVGLFFQVVSHLRCDTREPRGRTGSGAAPGPGAGVFRGARRGLLPGAYGAVGRCVA